jgi:signal transduction histidine kinase
LLGVCWDVSEQVQQEDRRVTLQMQLREASRQAGMAEVATGVLHSVGNVLNSLGTSTSLLRDELRSSRVGNVKRIAELIGEQGPQLAAFLQTDPRGRAMPSYLAQLGEHLVAENAKLRTEAEAIASHVGHIGEIVAAQQTYARRGGLTEEVDVAELVNHAIALNFTTEREVVVRRNYASVPRLTLDRHKLIQILGNLLSNARQALRDQPPGRKVLTIAVRSADPRSIEIEVEDSGVGISADVLPKLFTFGFTTKRDGHGFGLHASAILAQELGGELTGYSPGVGRGARFTLRLPATANGAGALERKLA